MPTPSPQTRMYRLLVSLEGTDPLVWRRLEVAGGIRLPWLHGALHLAMGWMDLHPCRFIVRDLGLEIPGDGSTRILRRLDLAPGDFLTWIHDPDREWRHRIKVEAILPPEPGVAYPRLLAGSGSCPTEDADGPEDHAVLILPSEEEEDPDQDVHWATRDDLVHPRAFDLWRTNRRLQKALKARPYA